MTESPQDTQETQDLPGNDGPHFWRFRKHEQWILGSILLGWAFFQMALPRFLILGSLKVRAVHLAFAITVVFLAYPASKVKRRFKFLHPGRRIHPLGYVLAALACVGSLYLVLDYQGIAERSGMPLLRDYAFSIVLILLLLEAARRVIGPALSIVAIMFTIYAFAGPWMPAFMAFKGVSVGKYITQVALSGEGIFGIPLDVSANTVFLYVLFGAMLAKVGAGTFFNDLAISLLGRFKGGPAKAAVVSSGFTGLVSGSSIANVVTTGTFTIPLMKKVGYPPKIAAATEVAASTNGQLMPPIMGAAAFIMAEQLNMAYLDVIKAAAIPAIVSYIALFYITHLEASKLGMRGLTKLELPRFMAVLKRGWHFLIPLTGLIVELMYLRHSPKLAAFNAILILIAVTTLVEAIGAWKSGKGIPTGLNRAIRKLGLGMIDGSWNMLSVALATATAGVVVGIVNLGIGGMIVQIVELLAHGNLLLLLLITAVASLILGMGLPTTATYIVMATITAPVIVTLSEKMGISPVPAIAAHLFCFYFGILADDTPPVGLAAYTAAAIAESDPVPTGIQGFIYDLRTAVIPFMFIFNPEIVMVGVAGFSHALLVFAAATFAVLCFTNAVQGWFVVRNRWYDVPPLLAACVLFACPATIAPFVGVSFAGRYWLFVPAMMIYIAVYLVQLQRKKAASTAG